MTDAQIEQRGDVTWVGSWSRVWPVPHNTSRKRFIARHVERGPKTVHKLFSTRKAAVDWLLQMGPIP